MEEVVKLLLASNQELTNRLVETNKALVAVVTKLADTSRPEPDDPFADVEWAQVPLHVPEDEEDANHLFNIGAIDKKQYEELLKQVGLNPEIHFDKS